MKINLPLELHMDVDIEYEYTPPDTEIHFPDGRWSPYQPGSVEILSIKNRGVDILHSLPDDEVMRLAMDIKFNLEND
jgi:hypothetical protein